MQSIRTRLERLKVYHDEQEGDFIPPVDSTAFQMTLIWFPIIFENIDGMSEAEINAVLALDPMDYADDDHPQGDSSRSIVGQAQAIIRKCLEERNNDKH